MNEKRNEEYKIKKIYEVRKKKKKTRTRIKYTKGELYIALLYNIHSTHRTCLLNQPTCEFYMKLHFMR